MSDRLQIINDALLSTGNATLNVEFDGSDEWLVGERAYYRALRYLLGKHPWNFASQTIDLVSRLPVSPHPVYTNAYALPGECLHVEMVWINGNGLTEYEIVNGTVCCRYDSGLKVKYTRKPEPGQWPESFVELLTMKVEAIILRGLNEDTDNARRRDGEVQAELADLRSYSDQEEPRRALMISRSGRARRTRRGQ